MAQNSAPAPDTWNDPVDIQRISRCAALAVEAGLLCATSPSLLFHDLDRLQTRIAELQRVFPGNTLHTIAIKANPLIGVLKDAVALGAGLEAASREEVWLAQAAGCPSSKIVFDSPAKTADELQFALASGVCINADNEEELARLNALMQQGAGSISRIGLRVNPLVGSGSIGITSVGDHRSKFGVAVADRDVLFGLYLKYPWLCGVHVHVGSQGAALAQLVQAAGVAIECAEAINAQAGRRQVTFIDIGGGLPARYISSHSPPTPRDYARALTDECPMLLAFDGLLITEFGRATQASCGWALSRVEYVKEAGGRKLAVLHLGADFLMRTVYQPEHWPHRFAVLNPDGSVKSAPPEPTDLVGPLCFGGDVVGTGLSLPAIEEGDIVAVCDTGAYTLSLWSRHCNRAIPAVVGVRGEDPIEIQILKARETEREILMHWSAPG